MSERSAKDVVDEMLRRQQAGDDTAVDDLVAEDMVNHAAGPQGRDGLKLILGIIDNDLGPVTVEQHHLIGDGDLVAQHLTLRGTHRASTMPLLADAPVSGRPAAWTFIHIWRISDGRIVEHWACRDDMGLLEQLRADPPGMADDAGPGRAADPAPDSSAVRTALWRALHVQVDQPPHLIADEIGLTLAAPEDGWQRRPDMHPSGTAPYRAAIVARTRFVEDLLVEEGIGQYVLLGAGLDTFAQRHADLAGRVRVFEVDQPGPQEWKRHRLEELGYGVPEHLRLIPVDFEAENDWWQALVDSGFDATASALVSSSGVSMYITEDATVATLRRLSGLAPGSIVAMTFMLPFDLVDEPDRSGLEGAARGARASGTPWISFYAPNEIAALAHGAGFADVRCVSTAELAGRYLADRTDGLRASEGEAILLART